MSTDMEFIWRISDALQNETALMKLEDQKNTGIYVYLHVF